MRTAIIAEIASSHNGDLELAKALINAAANNGADIVKFQDWRAENIPKGDSDKARYEKYEFPNQWYNILPAYCEKKGIEFLTTCFNADRVAFLAGLGLKRIKIASISMNNKDLLLSSGVRFEELIVSTAMHTHEEIEAVIDFLYTNTQKFTIMACTANYPTSYENANLERINELQSMLEFNEYANVGFSNHSLFLDVPKAALCMGIKYLEVHFSLSRYLPQIRHSMYDGGETITTHEISLEPHQLRELADWRDKVEVMQGSGEFRINEIEQAIKTKYAGRYGK